MDEIRNSRILTRNKKHKCVIKEVRKYSRYPINKAFIKTIYDNTHSIFLTISTINKF